MNFLRSCKRVMHAALENKKYRFSSMDYDAYWHSRTLSTERPRYHVIASLIEEGKSVLDVGCGDGGMLAYLKQLKLIQELGIDISQVAVEKARERGLNVRVGTITDLSMSFDPHSFDYVIMSEVIEHVPDPEILISKAWQLARQSLIVSFPNIAYYPHRLRLLFGKFPVQWAFHPGEHLRFWSIPDFTHWISQQNLVDAHMPPRVFSSNGFQYWQFHQKLPNLFGNQIVVCLKRKKNNENQSFCS